jgi:ADP-heptose:LPS heptosyltransferase
MRSILLINRMGIGDVVLTTPLAQLIKENIDAHVGMLVSAKATDIIQHHPYIDDVFTWNKKQANTILGDIRAKKYTEAIIVDERMTSTLVALRAGCKLVNYGLELTIGKHRLLSRKQYHKQAILDYSSYINLLDNDLPIAYRKPVLGIPPQSSQDKISDWLAKNNPNAVPLVTVIPRGIAENKNWMPEYFGVINEYLQKRGAIPIYLGSIHDEEYINSINGPKINAAGNFSLREVALLSQYTSFCIAPCTGTMHITATAGKPIIALYGPTQPERWAPENAIIAKAKNLSCMPCESLQCKNQIYKKCMREITPQSVIKLIEEHSLLS